MHSLNRKKKRRALALIQSGNLVEARTLLEDICRADRGDAHAWYLCAAVHQELGEPEKAMHCYRRVTTLEPGNAEAHYYLGEIYLALANVEAARDAYRQAIAAKPDYIEAYCNLGIAQERLGERAQAVQSYSTALLLDPTSFHLHYNLANMLRQIGKTDEAIAHYRKALALNPNFTVAYINLGNLLSDIGKASEALASYEAAVRTDPENADARNNLGLMLEQLDRGDDAIAHYRYVLARQPDNVSTLINLGAALADQGKYADAVACYRSALAIQPGQPEALNNLGNALTHQGYFKEAVASFLRVLELKPDYAEAHTNLGHTYQHLGQFDKAIACYQQAVAVDPDYAEGQFNLALIYLLRGEFDKGWPKYNWLWKQRGRSRPFQPTLESHTNLKGQDVFVHGEQGLGDELFFLRFLPWLKSAGAGKITFLPGAKLAPILHDSPFIDHLASPGENPAPKDIVASLGDIPRLFCAKESNQIPPPFKLAVCLEQLEAMRQQLAIVGPPPYVGVTWRAGVKKRNSLHKEIPLDPLAKILVRTTATVLILQRLPDPGEIEAFQAALGRPVHNLSALNEDLEQMLALLSLIDEYVGVSNTNMHLRAGAGKTARVLVTSPPEWRWMAEGKESPWFPGFTVYRQGCDGSWDNAFADLLTDLKLERA